MNEVTKLLFSNQSEMTTCNYSLNIYNNVINCSCNLSVIFFNYLQDLITLHSHACYLLNTMQCLSVYMKPELYVPPHSPTSGSFTQNWRNTTSNIHIYILANSQVHPAVFIHKSKAWLSPHVKSITLFRTPHFVQLMSLRSQNHCMGWTTTATL